MSLESNSALSVLYKRAEMLSRARSFFADRSIIEVDSYHLSQCAPIDTHIDILSVTLPHSTRHYLLSSPEYPLKRLLAAGSPDLYQLAHVFRGELDSPRHTPEFMMAEWYRKDRSFFDMIKETAHFCELFLGKAEMVMISYQEAFVKYLKIDPFLASDEQLLELLQGHGISPACHLDRDDLLNLLVSTLIEPKFDPNHLTCLYYYPPSQAALAALTQDPNGHTVAKRFELYAGGLELANGYHETRSSTELFARFSESNRLRVSLGKEPYPIDERFLIANEKLPDCCGVAVGFDRLMMLMLGTNHIQETYPLAWDLA